MTDEEKVTEKKNKVQPEENIERLKKIRQKRTSGVSMKYMAGAGAAVAVVIGDRRGVPGDDGSAGDQRGTGVHCSGDHPFGGGDRREGA